LEPQASSARGGGPPRKFTGIGVLDPPRPPKRPLGPIPSSPTSLLWRIAATLLLAVIAAMMFFLLLRDTDHFMKTITIGALALLFLAIPSSPDEKKSFRELQWKYPRVRTAAKEKMRSWKNGSEKRVWPSRHAPFSSEPSRKKPCWNYGPQTPRKRLTSSCTNIEFARHRELWGRSGASGRASSGGFYDLDWFNPQSNFYLSLHINYPNAADRILGSHQNPGGDIFLHGNCVSIGCIPITDDGIKEVYWLAVLVQNEGERHMPIHIFPSRLTDEGFKALAATHQNEPALLGFGGISNKATISSKKTIASRTSEPGPTALMFFRLVAANFRHPSQVRSSAAITNEQSLAHPLRKKAYSAHYYHSQGPELVRRSH